MADIFSGSLTFAGEIDLPDPTLFSDEASAPYFATYVTVRQGSPTANNWFQIVWGGRWEPMGGTPEYSSFAQYRYGTDYENEIEGRGLLLGAGILLDEQTAPGDGCAFCVVGGPLSVEQDPDDDQVRFSSSLGSFVNSLSDIGLRNENGLFHQTEHREWRQVWQQPVLDPPEPFIRSKLTAFNRRACEANSYAVVTLPPGSPPLVGWSRTDWATPLAWTL